MAACWCRARYPADVLADRLGIEYGDDREFGTAAGGALHVLKRPPNEATTSPTRAGVSKWSTWNRPPDRQADASARSGAATARKCRSCLTCYGLHRIRGGDGARLLPGITATAQAPSPSGAAMMSRVTLPVATVAVSGDPPPRCGYRGPRRRVPESARWSRRCFAPADRRTRPRRLRGRRCPQCRIGVPNAPDAG